MPCRVVLAYREIYPTFHVWGETSELQKFKGHTEGSS